MTMDIKRLVLYAALFFVGLTLWNKWQQDYPQHAPTHKQQVTTPGKPSALIPTPQTPAPAPSPTAVPGAGPTVAQQVPADRIVTVKTDTLTVKIDTLGGRIIGTTLSQYAQQLHAKDKPYVMFNTKPAAYFVAESGLISGTKQKPRQFTATSNQYVLEKGDDALAVKLTWQDPQGVQINKIFTFHHDKYLIDVAYQINNQSQQAWQGQFFNQLQRAKPAAAQKSGLFHIGSYIGASISDPVKKPYEKVSFKDMEKANLSRDIKGGWVAMQEHYFLSSWVANPDQTSRFYSRAHGNDLFTIGFVGPVLNVQPQQSLTTKSQLFVGPEITSRLKEIAPGLNLTVDYGWFWWLAMPIFWLLQHIYNYVGNWGWAIILVTVLIKLAFYKLSEKSYRSMANMRKLAPKLQALKERHGDDKAKLSQATMELYKKEKMNPLGGCLPILIQIPVFIALYWVLLESVQLRHAPFMLWIHDLSAPDPYFILPVLMGLSMLVQQKLNPPPPDPMQAKMMMLLPVVFTFLFLHFPSGLVLYWVVNNVLSIAQQWYIMQRVK